MKEYDILITEELSRTVTVTAEDECDAMIQVEHLYKNGDVILDESDFCGEPSYTIERVKNKKEKNILKHKTRGM